MRHLRTCVFALIVIAPPASAQVTAVKACAGPGVSRKVETRGFGNIFSLKGSGGQTECTHSWYGAPPP